MNQKNKILKIKDEYDVIVVGAGPIGLNVGINLKHENINYLILENAAICNSIYNYPTNMRFFTRAKDLQIGDHPFHCSDPSGKPTRIEALAYYRDVCSAEKLNVNQYERVLEVGGENGNFIVSTLKEKTHQKLQYIAKKIILATGYYDNPNLINVEGEELAHHYYTDGHPYFKRKVVIVGGGNSAAEAALDLYLHKADVTLVHRGEEVDNGVKYWLKPDIEGRIHDGDITAYFNTEVKTIHPGKMTVQKGKKLFEIDMDHVFILTGYFADSAFLHQFDFNFDNQGKVEVDEITRETNIEGIYIVGPAEFGSITDKIFIENGREHAILVTRHISKKSTTN